MRQAQRLRSACARALHGLHPTGVVEQALDAGQPLVVGVDGAEQVAGERAQRVGALELGAEGEAREPEIVHALSLTRAQAARHPGEAAAAVGKRLAQLRLVEAGERGGELFDRLVEIENELWIGVERVDGNIAGKQPPVAIDDVGRATSCAPRARPRRP